MATQRKTAAQKRAEADAPSNGNGDAAEARARLDIPTVDRGEKVNHSTLYSSAELARYDELDATRADRAQAILDAADYDGVLTAQTLRKLRPLLREAINPRYIVTTGPAEKGKPMTTTGIVSVQVQIERLMEVLGGAHYRTLAHWMPDGVRCHVHVVIGNDLQWCTLDGEDGKMQPYTLLQGTVAAAAGILAGVKEAEVIEHAHGWGGHARGSAPGDIWKGSYTNAAKLAIARVGPGGHVYLLDFEDDPHAPEARGVNKGGRGNQPAQQQRTEATAPAEGAPPMTDEQHEAAIAEYLAKDDDLKELREQAVRGMQMIATPVIRIHATLREYTTKRQLEDVVHRINLALDEDEAQGKLNVGGES